MGILRRKRRRVKWRRKRRKLCWNSCFRLVSLQPPQISLNYVRQDLCGTSIQNILDIRGGKGRGSRRGDFHQGRIQLWTQYWEESSPVSWVLSRVSWECPEHILDSDQGEFTTKTTNKRKLSTMFSVKMLSRR